MDFGVSYIRKTKRYYTFYRNCEFPYFLFKLIIDLLRHVPVVHYNIKIQNN